MTKMMMMIVACFPLYGLTFLIPVMIYLFHNIYHPVFPKCHVFLFVYQACGQFGPKNCSELSLYISTDSLAFPCSPWQSWTKAYRMTWPCIKLKMVYSITSIHQGVPSWVESNSVCFHLFSVVYGMKKQIMLRLVLILIFIFVLQTTFILNISFLK